MTKVIPRARESRRLRWAFIVGYPSAPTSPDSPSQRDEIAITDAAPAAARSRAERGESKYTQTLLGAGLLRAAAFVFLVTLVAYVLSPNVTNGDSYLSFPTAVSIVHSGDLTLDEFESDSVRGHYGFVQRNGSHFDYFPWSVALLFVPVVVALDAADAVGIGGGATLAVESDSMGLYQLGVASLVTALAAALVTMLAGERSAHVGRQQRLVALGVGLAFGLGTASWSTASRALWQHAPSMALLAGALLLALRLQRRPRFVGFVAIGLLAGAAFTVRPINGVAVVAFGMWCGLRGVKPLSGYIVGGSLVAIPWMLVNQLSYGQALAPYHSGGRIGLHAEFIEAILANLVSPSRGLLIFAPITVLAGIGVWLRARDSSLDALDGVAIAVFVGYLLVVSAFGSTWWAGHSIGPRFLTDTLPMLALLSVPAADALVRAIHDHRYARETRIAVWAVAALIVWSVAVNSAASVLRATNCWNLQPTNIDADPGRIWSWSDPQFLAGPRAVLEDGPASAVRGGSCAVQT